MRRRQAWLGNIVGGALPLAAAALGCSSPDAPAARLDADVPARAGSLVDPADRRGPVPIFPSVPAPGDPTLVPPSSEPSGAPKLVTVKGTPPVATGGDATLPAKTLILYDTSGPWGYLGELYAIYEANLAGHFGTFTAKPVTAYAAGDLAGYTAAIYTGSTYDEPIPTAFLDDVLAGTKPVIWSGYNVWQLANRGATFATTYGWTPGWLDATPAHQVSYKGQLLERQPGNDASGLLGVTISNAAVASVIASAVRTDGASVPWAVRAGKLTYIVENPIPYAREGDRVNAFADLLFDALAPTTATRHRAMLRLEDVCPDDDPAQLKALADYLYSVKVPFCVATIPVFTDPLGYYNGGKAQTLKMSKTSAFVSALKYMQSKGGTLLMHGYTHQYSNVHNPYSAVTADDFEFYRAHVDATTNAVIYDGPVSNDSTSWASGRLSSGLTEFKNAGLAKPTIFEFPHYAGSKTDYLAARSSFAKRYERSLYFLGTLTGQAPSYGTIMGQYFPFVVTDVYNSKVLPENLGNFEPHAYNTNPPRYPSDIVRAAQQNLVVRDGFASTFYHPYYFSSSIVADDGVTKGDQALKDIVSGIKAAGYTFVSCGSL